MAKINVYCKNRGWLFEDLKAGIAAHGATPSERPLAGYDAYICIRTKEAQYSPKPDKTVVQIHDMNYYVLPRFGMVMKTHPSQRAHCDHEMMLPIGSLNIEIVDWPERPTLGLFCRSMPHERKGLDRFAAVVDMARQWVDLL